MFLFFAGWFHSGAHIYAAPVCFWGKTLKDDVFPFLKHISGGPGEGSKVCLHVSENSALCPGLVRAMSLCVLEVLPVMQFQTINIIFETYHSVKRGHFSHHHFPVEPKNWHMIRHCLVELSNFILQNSCQSFINTVKVWSGDRWLLAHFIGWDGLDLAC